MLRYIPAKGLVADLPLICIKAEHQGIRLRAGPASMIARTTINTIDLPSCLYAPPVNLDKTVYGTTLYSKQKHSTEGEALAKVTEPKSNTQVKTTLKGAKSTGSDVL